MVLTQSARRSLARTPDHLFTMMLRTLDEHAASIPHLSEGSVSLSMNIQMRAIVVAQFQKAFGLTVDGHPGNATFSKLWRLNKPDYDTVLERAEKAAEPTGTIYDLGTGGYGWFEQALGPESDCSGFVCHMLGFTRKPTTILTRGERKMWVSTDSIWADAKGENRVFVECEKQAGAFVVYPDRRINGKTKQGHVALVTEMRGTVPWGYDCSWSQGKKGDAITFRSLSFFNRRKTSVYCKPWFWDPEES